jgi:hypothetical protein
MSNATLFLQKNKWPFFKAFALAALAYAIFGLSRDPLGWGGDNNSSKWYREVFFDDKMILPFLTLLVAPTLYAVIRRENPIWALIGSFVPAGVAVGALNLTATLVDMSTVEGLMASPVVYSPIALGLILSYACRVFAPPYEYKPETTGAVGVFICGIIMIFSFVYYVIESVAGAEIFLNAQGIFLLNGVILCCFAFNDKAQLSFVEVIAQGGLFTCLLGTVSMVTLYTATVAIGDPREIGPPLAMSQLMMLYGALVIILANNCGPRAPTDRELITRDWHLTEAYVFISLVVFPPLTLLERFNS